MHQGAILFAIIIVIVLYLTWVAGQNDEYLYGFWVADDDDFCERSEIQSMMLFIGEPERGWFGMSRPGYIIIMNDIANQGFTLNYRRSYMCSLGKYSVLADVTFDGEQLWEGPINICVDMFTGTMKITGPGDVIYAELVKQNDTTNIARGAKDAEIIEEND